MKDRFDRLRTRIKSLPPALVTAIGFGFILVLGVVDFLAPVGMSFTLFFLLGIGVVGWRAGSFSAALLAFFSASLLACHDWLIPAAGVQPPATIAWNAVSRLLLFGGTGWMLAELARLNQRLEDLVESRTERLKNETDQHKATLERLAEALSRFEQVTDNITEAFWLADLASERMLYVSPGYERIWGRPCEQLYRNWLSWMAALHPDDIDRVNRTMNAELAQAGRSVEYRISRPDGELRWIQARAFPVLNAEGQVYRLAGIAQDITERKQRENEAVRAESLLQAQRDVGIQLSLASDLQTALDGLLKQVLTLEGLDSGGIYLVDPQTGSLRLTCHAGNLSPEFLKEVAWYPADSERALLVYDRRPVYQLFAKLPIARGGEHGDEGFKAVAILPLCHEGSVVGALNVASHTHTDIPSQTRVVMEAIAAQAAGAIARIRAETERRRLETQILEIADREKARIGQEIHDGLCQHLVSLAFDANSLKNRLSAGHRSDAAIASRLAELLDRAITEARQLSRGLFPVALEEQGLPAALRELARNTSERSKVKCHFDGSESEIAISNVKCTHLYRIAQEAVTNAVKHAKARMVTVSFHEHQRQIELKITDDGVGLPEGPNPPSMGMGLHIMDYRARSIGGTLRIDSKPGSGCCISCCVPGRSS
jgi:PAS domain S-box-containing protein